MFKTFGIFCDFCELFGLLVVFYGQVNTEESRRKVDFRVDILSEKRLSGVFG